MNVSADLAKQVVETMRATPFVLAILIVNIIVLCGFTFTLYEVGKAVERRDKIIERCIK
jgi:hypothetical protein